jgi:MFS family permease
MAANNNLADRLKYYLKIRADKTSFIVIFTSIAGYFVWLIAFPLFGPILDGYLAGLKALAIEKARVVQLFLISMMVSSLVSGYLIDRLKKRLLFIWLSTLLASLLTFAFLWVNKMSEVFLLSSLLGLGAGIGPSAWGAFFADQTSPEDRGRIMGISIGLSMLVAYLFLIFKSSIGSKAGLMIIGCLNLLSLMTLFFKSKESQGITSSKRIRGASAKQLLLYASPIFLFYLVAGVLLSIVFPTVQDHVRSEIFYLIWAVPFLLGAILAGILYDTMGRNFPAIVGLAITGISLAAFGIFGIRLGYFFIVPLAVGFSSVTVLSFTVWADLAPARSRGLYYGVGSGLMAFALMVGLLSSGSIFGSVSASQIKGHILFSSVALFLCIPPLIVVEEALPKELIEQRRFQEYLDLARRKYIDRE